LYWKSRKIRDGAEKRGKKSERKTQQTLRRQLKDTTVQGRKEIRKKQWEPRNSLNKG